MHVSGLQLTDFRSWAELELELGPGPERDGRAHA